MACPCDCPSWARTRTLLIQSQTCCQLHQGADTPLRYASFPPGAGYATYPDIPSPATPPKHCKLWQHSPLRRICSSRFVIPCAALLALTAPGCRASIDAFGTSPAQARAAAENAFAAFAYRFYEVRREPSFERARELMGQYALMPSRVYRDSTLWNVSSPDSTKTLIVGASFADNQYTFASNRQAPPVRSLGDQRHSLNLKWLGGGDYEWFTQVDHAIGPVKPAHVGAALLATLTAAEGRSGDEVMADARSTFPETARHLAQLFTIDSLRTAHDGGATTTTFAVSFHPQRLRPRYSFFARFVDKYITPTVYRMQVSDHTGRPYMDFTGRDGRLVVRLRSRDHKLVSMGGVPVPMPDSLKLTIDVSAKYKLFRVGFTNLVANLTIERTDHRRAWLVRFQKEPAWHFPLAVDKLIKVPLRRPFQGRGGELSLGVRDDRGPMTISDRHARFVVNEGAIVRWLGRLTASAFGDFSGRTELEENLFLYETFEALRKDVTRN
jgi:hypothetical protein